MMPRRSIEVHAQPEQQSHVRLGVSSWLAQHTGLDVSALLATNTTSSMQEEQQQPVLQEVTVTLLRRAGHRSLDRLRLDLEADLSSSSSSSSRASLEASRQVSTHTLVSATLGTDCRPLLMLLHSGLGLHPLLVLLDQAAGSLAHTWKPQPPRQQQRQQWQQQRAPQRQQPHHVEPQGLSLGAAVVRRLGQHTKFQARWFHAPASLGGQAQLQLLQQVTTSHMLTLSSTWLRQPQRYHQPHFGVATGAGSCWVEAALTATRQPGRLLQLAAPAGGRGGDHGAAGDDDGPPATPAGALQPAQQQPVGAVGLQGLPGRETWRRGRSRSRSGVNDMAADTPTNGQVASCDTSQHMHVGAGAACGGAVGACQQTSLQWQLSCGLNPCRPADWLVRVALLQEGSLA